ncbi:unnamed protein product [Caenorhabditis auriculariae]|uniref:C2H2-type domain-containing protein n=1 Tax=Caenorhabditis auriculariae TaxID=2777116 RepID=A0A8S1GTA0_9PELO|nr:unnamed protein product [Caenorhabditis auriculariae]
MTSSVNVARSVVKSEVESPEKKVFKPLEKNKTTEQDEYVDRIRTKYLENMKQRKMRRKKQKDVELSTDPEMITSRLSKSTCDIDVKTLSCRFPLCGRTFSTVEVLSFHASYAHQEFSSTDLSNVTCMVCGRVWNSVKSKVVHMSAKHKIVAAEHNLQCIEQLGPVIAPNAPMARRLAQAAFQEEQAASQQEVFEPIYPLFEVTPVFLDPSDPIFMPVSAEIPEDSSLSFPSSVFRDLKEWDFSAPSQVYVLSILFQVVVACGMALTAARPRRVDPFQMRPVVEMNVVRRGGTTRALYRTFGTNEKAYAEKRVIGYSREQMFDVVANVNEYHHFVPWCRKSLVTHETSNSQLVLLEIGFPPLVERYTSKVMFIRPAVVHSVVLEGESLFKTLDTTFRFAKGLPDNPNTCTMHYDLVFEFKSSLHSRVAHMFFDKVVKTMVAAFLDRAHEEYGSPSVPHTAPQILKYKA